MKHDNLIFDKKSEFLHKGLYKRQDLRYDSNASFLMKNI